MGDEEEDEADEGAGEAGQAAPDDEDEAAGDVQEKAVPAGVFGSLAQAALGQEEGGEQQPGALERFKKRRVE